VTDQVRAAGCVVWRPAGEDVEVLVAHRPRYDDWSFPKGKLDPGEGDLEAAVREVQEETGFTGAVGAELATTRYTDHRGRPKVVRYWAMRVTGGAFEPNDEVDEVRWLPVAGAAPLLSYDHDRDVLQAFVGART
jgi:8-oxo-dGTP pyrophosphatase MutT (NUDIX family)